MAKGFAVQRRANQKTILLSRAKQGWGLLFCLGLVLLNTGCSTTGSSWYDYPGSRKSPAPVTAAWDPRTFIPAAAALVIAVTDSDQKISDWASRHHPVYGSQDSAESASNSLRGLLAASAVVTTFMAPGKQDAYLPGRPGNMVVGVMSAATTSMLTNDLKDSTGRARPNGVDQRSLPSSHSSAASTYASIASHGVNQLPISAGQRSFWNVGFVTLAAATAWARVEANAHYPTDVLAGFALGNFTTMLLHASMEDPEHPPQVGVILDQKYDAFMIIMSLPF